MDAGSNFTPPAENKPNAEKGEMIILKSHYHASDVEKIYVIPCKHAMVVVLETLVFQPPNS